MIDVQRSRVLGHVLVGRRPVAVAIGHGSAWVANADDGTVSRIDLERHEVVRTIGIGAPAIDLAVTSGAVWVANGSDGIVSRIDPGVEAVVATIDLRARANSSGTRPTGSTPMRIPSGSRRGLIMCSASTRPRTSPRESSTSAMSRWAWRSAMRHSGSRQPRSGPYASSHPRKEPRPKCPSGIPSR